MKIGALIKSARTDKGLTLKQTASLAGMSKPTIWKLECGQLHSLTFANMVKLLDVLDVPLDMAANATVRRTKR